MQNGDLDSLKAAFFYHTENINYISVYYKHQNAVFSRSTEIVYIMFKKIGTFCFCHKCIKLIKLTLELFKLNKKYFRIEIFKVVRVQTVVFWTVTSCTVVGGYKPPKEYSIYICRVKYHSEDRGNTLFSNTGNHLKNYTVPYPERPQSEARIFDCIITIDVFGLSNACYNNLEE